MSDASVRPRHHKHAVVLNAAAVTSLIHQEAQSQAIRTTDAPRHTSLPQDHEFS
jgi:hypothetical protein